MTRFLRQTRRRGIAAVLCLLWLATKACRGRFSRRTCTMRFMERGAPSSLEYAALYRVPVCLPSARRLLVAGPSVRSSIFRLDPLCEGQPMAIC